MNTHLHPSRTRAALLGVPAVVAVGLVAVPTLTSAADEPQITCGTVVTSDVRLTHDLLDCPGPGIVVGASQITIDLAGHVVDGAGSGAGIDASGGYDDLRITGGTVRGFQFGVHMFSVFNTRVDRLTAVSNIGGVIVERSQDVVLDRVTASDSVGNGIDITFSERITVVRSTAERNGLSGIVDRFSDGNRFERNTVTDNSSPGVTLDRSTDLFVSRNRAVANNSDGIQFTAINDAVIVRNAAVGNAANGIVMDEPGNRVGQNRAVDNGDVGISAPAGTVDRGGNRASGNLGSDCTGVRCG